MCEGFDRRPRRVSPGHPPGRNIALDAPSRGCERAGGREGGPPWGGGYHRDLEENARGDCAGGSKAMVAHTYNARARL
jgi:hypothetical protein